MVTEVQHISSLDLSLRCLIYSARSWALLPPFLSAFLLSFPETTLSSPFTKAEIPLFVPTVVPLNYFPVQESK